MTRSEALVCVVLLAGFGPGVRAAEPPAKLTPEQRKALVARRAELNTAGVKAYHAGKHAEAIKALEAALEVSRALYPKHAFPDGDANLASSLNNLGYLYQSQRKDAAAEPLYKDALEMKQRLFKGDLPLGQLFHVSFLSLVPRSPRSLFPLITLR
jgi:tetratricopeptide (TPR) repeat protein